MPRLLTQKALCESLEEVGIQANPHKVHFWIQNGLPTAKGSGKKPRFVLEEVLRWIISSRENSSAVQTVRDSAFSRKLSA